MKKITLALLLLCAAIGVSAKQVSADAALATAHRTLTAINVKSTNPQPQSSTALRLAYRPTDINSAEYYVFTRETGKGFVIVSGDDEMSPVFGYSDTDSFDPEQIPTNLKAVLDKYATVVDGVRQGTLKPHLRTATGGTAIGPLVTAKWNQSAPYNNQCPLYDGTNRAATGCVATAMAIILQYHQYPAQGYGSVTTNDVTYDLSQSSYDWTQMPQTYGNSYTTTQADQVAQLMVDLGHAVDMEYGAESSAYTTLVPPALVNNFGYDNCITYVMRDTYTDDGWLQLLRDNLADGLPMMYGGNSESGGGHQFVCDGIDSDNLLHINWGWGGYADGYFDMDEMCPISGGIGGGDYQFNVGQDLVCWIKPAAQVTSWTPHFLLCDMAYKNDVADETTSRLDTSSSMLLINYTVYTGNGNIASSAYHGVKICDAAGTAVVSYCSSNAADYPDATAGYMLTLPLNVRNLAVGKYRIVPFYRTAAKGDDLSYWVGDVYDDQFIIEKKDDGYIYKATSMTTGMEAIAATADWSLTSTASTLLLSGVPEGAIAKVYTPNGMLTATATIAASPTAIDMTAAQPGMYVVSVVAADGATKTFKAILRK